jgi:GT2 family glycosyltransferase
MLLEDFFFSIALQKNVTCEIFLLDNDPNETSKSLVANLTAKYNLQGSVFYIQSLQNVGFAGGNNIVLRRVLKEEFDYILLANNDVYVSDKTLLYNLKEKCEKLKMVTPTILYYGTNKIWFSGGHLNKYKGINIHENEFEVNNPTGISEVITDFAPACFLMVHRDVFDKIGLFDEKYFVYWEDIDFCLRARNAGFKISLLPQLNIDHKVSATTGGRISLFSTYYFLRNRLYFIRKSFRGFDLYVSLTYTYMTSFVKIVLYDFQRKKIIMKAIKDSHSM